jgi:DASS family divalent anion:Na+ symporter
MFDAMPIFVASVGAVAVAVIPGILAPAEVFSGFSQGFILLIAVAFLIARGVVKSGLGNRIAYHLIARIGRTTLGLGYAIVITDVIIAPAFPSNTARAGVLFPIAQALALGTDSHPDEATRRRTGAFLMMMAMTGLAISSAMWLTAMASNPAGAAIAAGHGVVISFQSWFVVALVPSVAALVVVPLLLYKVFPPEVTHTPEAPEVARQKLKSMGPMTFQEWVMGLTFLGLVSLWALSGFLGIDKTAIAFGGLFVIMVSGIFSVADLKEEGGTLEVFVWFAILFSLSTSLNQLGFMTWLGGQVAGFVTGQSWPLVYAVLLSSYVLIHYFFVSQSAQMLALYPVYLTVGITAGVPPVLIAYMLLFATNFFSVLTPQASSANVIFVGSGYVTSSEVYRYGGVVTIANTLVYGVIGSVWILAIRSWI